MLIVLAYTAADLGGENAVAWLGIANTLAVAAVAPMVGSISDLLGRRYVALLGTSLMILGLITVGTAHRMEVAIGGTAIIGVGGGLTETVAVAGLLELAPVKSRGKYFGTGILLDLPFGAILTYGMIPELSHGTNTSTIVLYEYLEMGRLDTDHDCFS